MAGNAFVDTNVLLRAIHHTLPNHLETNTLIYQMWDDDVELWISRQVIREYLVQVTHPNTFRVPETLAEIMEDIANIRSLFRIVDETRETTDQLLKLLQKYPTVGKQIHDANIVATMMVNGIDTLLTINVADMKRFSAEIKVISPIKTP